MTRAEIAELSTTELRVIADGLRRLLSSSWSRGESGSLTALYDLALLHTEATYRGAQIGPLRPDSWLSLFEADDYLP